MKARRPLTNDVWPGQHGDRLMSLFPGLGRQGAMTRGAALRRLP
jgi:hypothetical protein